MPNDSHTCTDYQGLLLGCPPKQLSNQAVTNVTLSWLISIVRGIWFLEEGHGNFMKPPKAVIQGLHWHDFRTIGIILRKTSIWKPLLHMYEYQVDEINANVIVTPVQRLVALHWSKRTSLENIAEYFCISLPLFSPTCLCQNYENCPGTARFAFPAFSTPLLHTIGSWEYWMRTKSCSLGDGQCTLWRFSSLCSLAPSGLSS